MLSHLSNETYKNTLEATFAQFSQKHLTPIPLPCLVVNTRAICSWSAAGCHLGKTEYHSHLPAPQEQPAVLLSSVLCVFQFICLLDHKNELSEAIYSISDSITDYIDFSVEKVVPLIKVCRFSN